MELKKDYRLIIGKIASLVLSTLVIFAIFGFLKGMLGYYDDCDEPETQIAFTDKPKSFNVEDFPKFNSKEPYRFKIRRCCKVEGFIQSTYISRNCFQR